MVKIIEAMEGTRIAKGWTRARWAEEIEREGGIGYDKERLDKIVSSNSCPRAETLAEMAKPLGMPFYPSFWFRSKKVGGEDD